MSCMPMVLIGWNTFPVPKLTERNKADLTACAEDILLTREAHFPATIADLYAPDGRVVRQRGIADNLTALNQLGDPSNI